MLTCALQWFDLMDRRRRRFSTGLLAEMHAQVGHIDLYNVYGPCISGSGAQQAGSGSNKYKAPIGDSSLFNSKLGGQCDNAVQLRHLCPIHFVFG